MNGRNYTSFLKSEIITDNTTVNGDGAGCISFELLGSVEALINDVIPLTVDKAREINELPNVANFQDFKINFNSLAVPANCSILLTRTFYKEV
jgi:hypothetical protein